MDNMTYEQTCQLERNIKIKNKAKEIVKGFKEKVVLNLKTKKGLRFTIRSDSHNATYVEIDEKKIVFICDFLHENYYIIVDKSHVFDCIQRGDRVINHLAAHADVRYNEHDYK